MVDQWPLVSGLCGPGSRAGAKAGQHRRYGYLGSHKGAGVRAAIETAGASLLLLPPYSPDLNPIENAFAN
jgi:transposase